MAGPLVLLAGTLTVAPQNLGELRHTRISVIETTAVMPVLHRKFAILGNNARQIE
jgi:hypothetical protein